MMTIREERKPYESALLVCGWCQHPTVHQFKYGVRERDPRQHIISIATYYGCEECGNERIYGREQPYLVARPPAMPRVIEENERKAA